MKINAIYSNRPKVFPDIHLVDGVNVVYAEVRHPEAVDLDSHNLGKSILIDLIDFLLLKGFSSDLFLYNHRERFEGFVFFLELDIGGDHFVTVRRSVRQNTKVWFKEHTVPYQRYTELAQDEWSARPSSFRKARSWLDSKLNLDAVRPWNFRKGVGYFLRGQSDYRDVFQLARFSVGRHREWKPFMARLLGFNHEPIEAKYDAEEQIGGLETAKKNLQRFLEVDSGQYDRVKGAIQVARQEAVEARERVSRFSFRVDDARVNQELVTEVETKIAERNERIYALDYEIGKLSAALEKTEGFDLDTVERVFQEAELAFPRELKRSYAELVEFNRRLTTDRNAKLSEALAALSAERRDLADQLDTLDQERSELLAFLSTTEPFEKFRVAQEELLQRQTRITRLEEELKQLDALSGINKEVRRAEEERAGLIEDIEGLVNRGNPTYDRIRSVFNSVIKTVVGVPAVLSITINQEGNLEFSAEFLLDDISEIATGEDEGYSYRRLLCAAFDLALLVAHQGSGFYRFVYHDGILEGLDDRKKLRLLELVRDLCREFGIQYIFTVIDSDVPRAASGERVEFLDGEIVRTLHDDGDDGRLFRMPKF